MQAKSKQALKAAIAGLKKARKLIEEKGWCQEQFAVDEYGNEVFWRSRDAVKFCVTGAVRRAILSKVHLYSTNNKAELHSMVAHSYLGQSLPKNFDGCVADWNDEPGRTKRQVLGLFDKAIKAAQENLVK